MNFRTMGFKLGPLKVADFKAAREIFVDCFHDTRISDFQLAWKERIRATSLGIYTKEDDLVGFLLCDLGGYKFENTHITFLAVHPDFQKFRLVPLTHLSLPRVRGPSQCDADAVIHPARLEVVS